jgi:hypothetical protein
VDFCDRAIGRWSNTVGRPACVASHALPDPGPDVTLQPADYLAHLSNLLLLVSYSVRDILWLRWFAVAAAFIVMPYYLMQPQVLWPPVWWGSVFAVINLVQIARIYAERRPVVLGADEQRLYDLAFRTLRPREFLALAMVGEWRDAAEGEVILQRGRAVDALVIAIAGSAQACYGERVLGNLAPGELIGSAPALLGEPAPIDARFVEAARYIRWPVASLRTFVEKRPDLRNALLRSVNRDLARKLETLAVPGRPS